MELRAAERKMDREDVTIRIASAEDAAALATLAERTFRDAFAAQNTPEDMDLHCAGSFGPAIQARELADPSIATFVGDAAGRLVAYAQLRWGAPPACVGGANPVEVQRFYVAAEHHGKGLAQRLMHVLVDHAQRAGADSLWLGVWERNPRAIAFYDRCGFARVGEQIFVLGRDPQRDLVLARRIDR